MIEVPSGRWYNIQFKLFSSIVLSKSQLQCNRVILNVDCIISCKLECLECRVELFYWVRPTISICRYKITSMTDACIVKVIICIFDTVFKANSNAYPTYKFFYLYPPLRLGIYIKNFILKGKASYIRANLCPLDSIPVC
jgi:hypothetical protein